MNRGITQEQVYTVADELMADGITPTIDSVREGLGHTGSRSTIGKHLASWRAGTAKPVIPEALQRVVTDLYEKLQAEAQAKIAAAQAEWDETEVDLLEMVRNESQALAEETSRHQETVRQFAAIQQQLARLQSEFETLRTAKAELDVRHATLKEENHGFKQRLREERDQREKYELLMSDQLRQVRDAAALDKEQLVGERNQVQAQLDMAREVASELRQTNALQAEQLRVAETARAESQLNHEELQRQLDLERVQRQSDVDTWSQRLAAENDRWRGAVESSQQLAHALQERYAALDSAHAALQEKLHAKEAEAAILADRLAQHTADVTAGPGEPT